MRRIPGCNPWNWTCERTQDVILTLLNRKAANDDEVYFETEAEYHEWLAKNK